ncbi:hypothetical protein B0O99DRAFT_44733 [Bisporella sp. PMI_857]|nr:hypothetical protein B0O99DRAFT_44733 [Bisporella sp. PMI_857]
MCSRKLCIRSSCSWWRRTVLIKGWERADNDIQERFVSHLDPQILTKQHLVSSRRQTPPALRRFQNSLSSPVVLICPKSPMSNTRKQILLRRKRHYAETDLTKNSRPELQFLKRYKLHSAEFYDSLPKVWLTCRALKELDRRVRQINRP